MPCRFVVACQRKSLSSIKPSSPTDALASFPCQPSSITGHGTKRDAAKLLDAFLQGERAVHCTTSILLKFGRSAVAAHFQLLGNCNCAHECRSRLQLHHESSSSECFQVSDSVTTVPVEEDNRYSSGRKLLSVRIYRWGDVEYLYDCTMMEVSLLVQ